MDSQGTTDDLRSRALAGDASALDALLELERDRKSRYIGLNLSSNFGLSPGEWPTEQQELHSELDKIYDRLRRWELTEPGRFDGSPSFNFIDDAERTKEANIIYQMVMGFACGLTRGIRQQICPTYVPGNAIDMRRALCGLLNLVLPVMPHRAKSIAPGWFSKDSLWTQDLVRWLGMLDQGSVPEIFSPNTQKTPGFRASDWTRKRFRALMALWCIHLQQCHTESAALNVAVAFGLKGARSGDPISKNARKMLDAAQSDQKIFGLTVDEVKRSVSFAFGPPTVPDTHERRILAKTFYHIVFGVRDVDSMEEAGARYQRFESNSGAANSPSRQPGKRHKRPSA